MNPTSVIETQNLTKAYKGSKAKAALDNLNLSVQQGEVFGYLGPNGAGKTTTIRLLLDLIRPTSGSAQVMGLDVNHDSVEVRKRIGFLPGELNLWGSMTALQIINYLGSLRGVVDMKYVQQLAERLQFDLTKKVRSYSTGNKRKLGIIIAFMNKPELLILDEPTSGLDPLMQQVFYELVNEVKAEGRTVFLSSHILSEVQAICDRVGILRAGELKTVERVSDLVHADFRWVTVRFRGSVPVGHLANIPGVHDVSVNGNTLKLKLTGEFDPLLRAIDSEYIVDIDTEDPSLEEVFLTFYGNGSALKHENGHQGVQGAIR